MKYSKLLFLFFVIIFHSIKVYSDICSANYSPFHQYHYLPCTALSSSDESLSIRLISGRSNIFYYDEEGILNNESAIVDGEISKQVFVMEKRFNQFLIGGEISQIAFSEGSWDSTIESWHTTFNFVNWDRENYPRNKLLFHYQSGDDQLTISEQQKFYRSSYHIGYALYDNKAWLNSIRVGRTYSDDHSLVSSVTSWLTLQSSEFNLNSSHAINAHVGLSQASVNGVLSEIQEPWVMFAGVKYKFKINRYLKTILDFSGNTAHYSSESIVLGKPASQFSGGVIWGEGENEFGSFSWFAFHPYFSPMQHIMWHSKSR